MNKRANILLLIIGAVLLSFFIYQYINAKRLLNWRETYSIKSKEPYGTKLIYNLMQSYFPEQQLNVLKEKISRSLPANPTQKANYVLIGEALLPDSADVNKLLTFVKNGNDAFIATKTIPIQLTKKFNLKTCYQPIEDSTSQAQDSLDELVSYPIKIKDKDYFYFDYSHNYSESSRLNFLHPNLKQDSSVYMPYLYHFDTTAYAWNFIDSSFICRQDSTFLPLGIMNDSLVNFVRFDYGKGHFYLHTTPLVFTNYFLLKEKYQKYCSKVLSHLGTGIVYWDEYSPTEEFIGRQNNIPDQDYANNEENSTPLQYILSQKALAWAWYLTLALLLLYLIFRTKRKQRVIPILAPKTNTSVDFISTIGNMYFTNQNHRQIALQKTQQLLIFIRERYGISAKNLDNRITSLVQTKSGVDEKIWGNILSKFQNIERYPEITEDDLIEYHLLLEQFYEQCK